MELLGVLTSYVEGNKDIGIVFYLSWFEESFVAGWEDCLPEKAT